MDTILTPTPNGLNLQAINPKNGQKYSPNLFRWLTNPKRPSAIDSRVYTNPHGEFWIGLEDAGGLIGCRLNQVLYNGRKATSGYWIGVGPLTEVADFWTRYEQHGRCAIDVEHTKYFVGDETRWQLDSEGTTRTCMWCKNATQVLRRWTETVQRSQWIGA